MKTLPLLALFATAPLWCGCEKEPAKHAAAKPAATAAATPAPATVAVSATVAPKTATETQTKTAAPTPPAAAPDTEMVPLKIEFPNVNIDFLNAQIKLPVSYLTSVQVRNLAKTPLQVPKGIINLARDKPVTSSDENPIVGELQFVTDGDKDADEGYEVELSDGPQWVQIDLQKPSAIYAIAVWHYHRQKDRAYKSVVIQISDDKDFQTGVTTIFNNDYEDTLRFGAGKDLPYVETRYGRIIPANGIKGRYVRLWSHGNNFTVGNHYIEVEVWGK
ncbi:MAG: discoidin domain-containing protein [Puniceicoccales bacterium]|jgi:hypothetical protein|nr:discoidin domain-containing protein [Puniceicoccales bacterium]